MVEGIRSTLFLLCSLYVCLSSEPPPEATCALLAFSGELLTTETEILCTAAHYRVGQPLAALAGNRTGALVLAEPFDACTDVASPPPPRPPPPRAEAGGAPGAIAAASIALARRGGCSFAAKAQQVEAAGFVALLLLDGEAGAGDSGGGGGGARAMPMPPRFGLL